LGLHIGPFCRVKSIGTLKKIVSTTTTTDLVNESAWVSTLVSRTLSTLYQFKRVLISGMKKNKNPDTRTPGWYVQKLIPY
jgi:hypothetical protein